jgi:polyferredoxin
LPAVSRQSRQTGFTRALRQRRVKQGIMGAAFLMFLAAGWFFPMAGYFIPACMVLGIGLATLRGRTWCDWLCLRGSFLDAWLEKISPGRKIPPVFRGTPLRLGVMTLLMTVLTVQIVRLWPDPWAIGGFFVILLTVTTVVGVVLGLIFHQRTWCHICPIGTMSSWVGKNRRPLVLAAEKCVECKRCGKTCPMQLAPQEMKHAGGLYRRGDCLKCGLCLENCPTQALMWQA